MSSAPRSFRVRVLIVAAWFVGRRRGLSPIQRAAVRKAALEIFAGGSSLAVSIGAARRIAWAYQRANASALTSVGQGTSSEARLDDWNRRVEAMRIVGGGAR